MSSFSFLFIAFFAIVAIAFATPAVEKRRSGQVRASYLTI